MDTDVARDAKLWYGENWDPDLSVGEWFRLMYESGWGYPTWPVQRGGKGLPIARLRRFGPPAGRLERSVRLQGSVPRCWPRCCSNMATMSSATVCFGVWPTRASPSARC